MEERLIELGLSKNEAKIYLYLLKNPDITTGLIIKETGIVNSRVYESINSLIRRGLVSYTVQNNGKHFDASPPEKFLQKEEERKGMIEKMIPDLNKLRIEKDSTAKTSVYEGFEGFKTAFSKIIDDCPQKGVINIIGFSEQIFGSESLRTFITNTNLKSSKKKQKLNILLDLSVKETFGKDRKREKYTEVRYMPEGYISPSAIDIFEDYVYIFLWDKKPFVFMIKNEKIAESFKQYFHFLWGIARR